MSAISILIPKPVSAIITSIITIANFSAIIMLYLCSRFKWPVFRVATATRNVFILHCSQLGSSEIIVIIPIRSIQQCRSILKDNICFVCFHGLSLLILFHVLQLVLVVVLLRKFQFICIFNRLTTYPRRATSALICEKHNCNRGVLLLPRTINNGFWAIFSGRCREC